jgi:hypothetical protein
MNLYKQDQETTSPGGSACGIAGYRHDGGRSGREEEP